MRKSSLIRLYPTDIISHLPSFKEQIAKAAANVQPFLRAGAVCLNEAQNLRGLLSSNYSNCRMIGVLVDPRELCCGRVESIDLIYEKAALSANVDRYA